MVETYKPMDAFDSMTESTFIVMPKGKSSSTSRKSTGRVSENDGFVRLLQGREPVESLRLRQKLFEDMWAPLEQLLIKTEQEVNSEGVEEICNFVKTSYTRIDTEEKGWLDPPFAELATALAFAGINTGDHSKLFSSLRTRLHADGHRVALMESQYCSTLPAMLKYLLDQIIDGEEGRGAVASTKTVAHDMGLLRLWWEEKMADSTQHLAKEAGSSSSSSRIVIILQDLEGFAPLVVDDFIRIASNYCSSVPIVLVLGLATSNESLHQSLTKASISLLNVERFNLQRSKQCIDAIIEEVFVKCQSALSFGAEAYKSLLDQFLLYSFSITAFVKKMKYALMDFFYAHPLSVLASMVERSADDAIAVVDCPIQLSHDQIELVRMQRSTREFLEQQARSNNPNYLNRAITDDRHFQEAVIPEMLKRLVFYRQTYSLGIKIVHAMQCQAPEPTRKPMRTLHYYGLSQPFDECTHWKTLSAVARRMKAPEMESFLNKLADIVNDASRSIDWSQTGETGQSIPELLLQAQQLLANPEESKASSISAEKASDQTQARRIRTRTDMENRPFLLFESNSNDQMLSALDKCCSLVERILKSCLSSYRHVPLHEVFYYKHSLLLDTAFSAQPRAAVQVALGKTPYYINCECCAAPSSDGDKSDSDACDDEEDADQRIVPSMQDTSIAYRLHQECGRMINLYDWYLAFSSVVEKEAASPASTRTPDQSEIQARFLRAVEEMRFLGFIKSTQRKTDHVMRLTWGM